MKIHDLKIWPDAFEAVWHGHKTAEFRKDDRDYQVGDWLRLNEWEPETSRYTGRVVTAEVSHIVRGGRFGFPDGYAMLSMKSVAHASEGRGAEPRSI